MPSTIPWPTQLRSHRFLLLLLGGFAALAFSGLFDMAVARLCYFPGQGFVLGSREPWRTLYEYGEWPALLMAGGSLLLLVFGSLRTRLPGVHAKLHRWRPTLLFFLLLYLLGPGLLVNVMLKDHWGRPRPSQVAEFGGDQPFRYPFEQGDFPKGKSFPCGHASIAFYLCAPYFVLRTRKRRLARVIFGYGFALGCLMGIARILQGGHFLSDVLWSGTLTLLLAWGLSALLHPDRFSAAPVLPRQGGPAASPHLDA